MNGVSARILAFFLLIIWAFVGVSQLIPQVSSYPQKALSREEFSRMSAEQLVARGREVFGSGGIRCSQCHAIEGAPGRGPNLGGVGGRAPSRAQTRAAAAGKPYSPQEYLLESLIHPEAFVVEGHASPSIMPQVFKPPMDLSEEDIQAVVAFLESLGGRVTMAGSTQIPQQWRSEIAAAKNASREPVRGDIANGKSLFYQRLRCVACHKTRVNGVVIGGILGPDLSRLGEIRGQDSIREIIVNPPGDIMPRHFKENLTPRELDDLVAFLANLRSP